jgi:hypothetical protein
MNIEKEQLKQFLNPNLEHNKENITLKDDPEYFLERDEKNYIKLNLDPKTTSFNRF